MRWDGSSIATERGEGKIRGQFFGGRVLKVEMEKAAEGYVPLSERAGQAVPKAAPKRKLVTEEPEAAVPARAAGHTT